MKKTLIRTGTIVTMDDTRRVIHGGAIIVNGSVIERVMEGTEVERLSGFEGEVVRAENLVAIPGFIQTHIHLCQTLFRGLAEDLELLDWLRLKIFPYEAAHNERSIYVSAMVGLAELIRSGTTTIMDMGTVHHEEEIIRAIEESGMRAYAGKAMMDMNEPYPSLSEPAPEAVSSSRALAERWHMRAGGRIRYAVAPRFVLSCSDHLLREAYDMTRSIPGVLFHTHAAENKHELSAVRRRCGMDNIEFFDSLGILHENTCLAHCIWLNEREVGLMSDRHAKVLHCPSSNLKLGSGVARIPEFLSRGITVSLGADGAPCNNSLDMFHEMRLAATIQKPFNGPRSMDAQTVFSMATIGGAVTLGWEREIGSIEEGKRADVVLLDAERMWNPYGTAASEPIYSTLVYTCTPENVRSVMIDGRWCFKDGVHTTIDEDSIVREARDQLKTLMTRVIP